MPEISIRKSTLEDAAGILDVQEQTWLATYPNKRLGITTEAIKNYFASKGSREERIDRVKERTRKIDENTVETIAQIEDKVVGWCVAKQESETLGRIQAIYVLPDFQGQNIGGRLMQQALAWLGGREILVNVAEYNQNAISFYERFGFRKTGNHVDSFKDRRNPARPSIPEIEMKR